MADDDAETWRATVQQSRMLEIGKAAEYLVCADLILQGHRAFPSAQGLPYDVILDVGDKILRVQVKSTLCAKNISAKNRSPRTAYSFNVRGRGGGQRRRLSDAECDIVALVALDTRAVAYVPLALASLSMQIPPAGEPPENRTWRYGWMRNIDQWPLSDALAGPEAYVKLMRKDVTIHTHCKHGHEYAVTGYRLGKGICCLECDRRRGRYPRKPKTDKGTHHNALDDAIAQAVAVSAALRQGIKL